MIAFDNFVPLEIEMNTLPSRHKQCHFNLTTYPSTQPGKTKNNKTADRLLQCVLLNRLFQTFAESRAVFRSFISLLVRKLLWQSSDRKYFTFARVYHKFISELNVVNFSMRTKVKLS